MAREISLVLNLQIITEAHRAFFSIRERGVKLTTIKFIEPTGRLGRLYSPSCT